MPIKFDKAVLFFIIIFKLDTDHSYELKETKTNSKTPTVILVIKTNSPKHTWAFIINISCLFL